MKTSLSQINLFEEKASDYPQGLDYKPDFITPEQESELVSIIDRHPWLNDLKRRVQHYGYKYDYQARAVTKGLNIGPMPDWLAAYCNLLHTSGIFPNKPDQVIINEYLPGQGISPHTDCVPCFEETVASLSLGSGCVMDFSNDKTGETSQIFLEPRSLLTLKGDARYFWKHGIASRKADRFIGTITPRNRRISLTFRKVILQA